MSIESVKWKIRERILNEETIVELVTLVAEEIDAMAGELSGRLEVVEAELSDVRKRLEKLYEAIETSELTLPPSHISKSVPSTVQGGFKRYSLSSATAAQTTQPKLEDSASFSTRRPAKFELTT